MRPRINYFLHCMQIHLIGYSCVQILHLTMLIVTDQCMYATKLLGYCMILTFDMYLTLSYAYSMFTVNIIPQKLHCSPKQPPSVRLCFHESQEQVEPLDFPQSSPVNII